MEILLAGTHKILITSFKAVHDYGAVRWEPDYVHARRIIFLELSFSNRLNLLNSSYRILHSPKGLVRGWSIFLIITFEGSRPFCCGRFSKS